MMEENRIRRNRVLGQKIIKELESRNMEGYYADSKEEALQIALKLALDMIPEGSSISWGGSVSIKEIGLQQAVCQGNYKVYDRDATNTPEERRQVMIDAYGCDYFITSTNAITSTGELVNVDGMANRVSAIAFGPKNVLMIVGMNKVVKSVEDAISRTRNEAAPVNAQRFGIDTPCVKTGVCFDCKSPDTICCQTLITRYSKIKGRIKIILVNEDLGF